MVELTSLWLPIILSTVALFFIGFITWMVLPVHKADWQELPDEGVFGQAVRDTNIQHPTRNSQGRSLFTSCTDRSGAPC